ncbi:hypothetical protein AMECASPLE_012993 [Ameca splendens]|uniref:Secreted protein n=1 Tax=Ameca splendens TaxID=208324 RepID=A0ABV0XQA2_9TELE
MRLLVREANTLSTFKARLKTFLFEATPGLALCLAVAPSWGRTSAKLLLPTTQCSPSTDDTLCAVFQCLTLSLLDIATG